MSNNQEHINTDNMENQTQQALEKDSAQYANEVTGAENAAEKDSAGKKPGSTVPGRDEKRIRELAESIYDLDAEVYAQLGSSLGRVFNRDRKRCVDELTHLMLTRPQGNLVRSEIALIGNMARTIENKEERKLVMTEYNRILTEVMSLPTSFASGDVINAELAKLNTFNLKNRFSENDHLIVCISWTYGSGGVNIGFKLADKLKINFYDAEIFEAVLKRLEAQKDSIQDSVSYGIKPGIKKEQAHDQNANVNPSEAFIPERHLTLRQRMREFSRFHGLPKRDAVFFNESDLLVDMAKKEDFVILGRCGDAIMANNNIPHISIYITAPFEQRIKRAMEIDSSLTVKQARHMLKHLDHVHSQYYHYYTNRNWGHSNNYDLCINSASYGIDGTVDFIYRMIMAREEDK